MARVKGVYILSRHFVSLLNSETFGAVCIVSHANVYKKRWRWQKYSHEEKLYKNVGMKISTHSIIRGC